MSTAREAGRPAGPGQLLQKPGLCFMGRMRCGGFESRWRGWRTASLREAPGERPEQRGSSPSERGPGSPGRGQASDAPREKAGLSGPPGSASGAAACALRNVGAGRAVTRGEREGDLRLGRQVLEWAASLGRRVFQGAQVQLVGTGGCRRCTPAWGTSACLGSRWLPEQASGPLRIDAASEEPWPATTASLILSFILTRPL